ncbi:transmembrane protein 119 [Thomomys bottae]
MVPGPLLALLLLLLLNAAPAAPRSAPLPAAFLEDLGGSGEADGPLASTPSLPPPRTPALSATATRGPQPTPRGGPARPPSLLEGLVDFFRQYAMLIAVVGSLAFLLMFIVCAALITRQKHKATAYYPSSFPKKKYVDQSDRAGGPRAFSEVPDRAPDSRPEEGLDSSLQLQADILAATQNLKSPARAAPASGEGARLVKGSAQGSQGEAPEAPAPGNSGEKPEVPEEVGSAEAAVAASRGHEDPGTSFSAQEAQGPAGPPENPCACSTVSPSV